MRKILPNVGSLGRRILRQIISGSIEEPSPYVPAEFDSEDDLKDSDYEPPHPFFRDRFDEAEIFHDAASVTQEVLRGSLPVPSGEAAVTEPTAVPVGGGIAADRPSGGEVSD